MSWISAIHEKYSKLGQQLDLDAGRKGTSCYFCNTTEHIVIDFQGKPICLPCNDKMLKRIKLILKFE
jgi:hypothetical protein